MVRILAWAQAVLLGGNGLVMLFAGLWWYGVVPGVPATGPYNPHFVRDIGAAYLVVGLSHAAFALRPRAAWSALVASAGFLTLHAGVHLYDAVCGTKPLQDLARDALAIFLPTAIAIGLALAEARPAQQEMIHAQGAA